MMKLMSLIGPKTGVTSTLSSEASREKVVSLQGVLQVMEHFPIGVRLQYYPEYQKETKIDTSLVAYVVNDFVVYSNKDIKAVETGKNEQAVEVMQNGKAIPIERIYSFGMLIPHLVRKEIDFKRSQEKGSGGSIVPTERLPMTSGAAIPLTCSAEKPRPREICI